MALSKIEKAVFFLETENFFCYICQNFEVK